MQRKEEEEANLVKEKGQIENEMLSMAQGMKQFATAFKVQFAQDEKVLNSIGQHQEINMKKTTEERDNLASIQKASVSSFCQRVFMLVIATATLLFMFFFVWLFPNKVYSADIAE